MEDNNFFRKVWRFNAVVIMLAGILGLALTLFAFIMIFKDFTRDRSVRNIVNVDESPEANESWELGNIITVRGSDYIMIPLQSEQKYSSGSYSKSASSVRNYLFFDTSGNEKYWLFSKNDYLITQADQLPSSTHREPSKDTEAILYYVVKSDTNRDKLLTVSDLKTVAISRPDGTQYTELLSEIDFLNGYRENNNDSIVIIYQRKNIGYSARINLVDFSVSNEEKLPSVQH